MISDANAPGEGEHKILDYIRCLRYHGKYNANLSHILFSNDADMIFLALLLKEKYIYVMKDIPVKRKSLKNSTLFQTSFLILSLEQLRKYLKIDFSEQSLMKKKIIYDFERIIDDWVFISYFAGNDFLPCLPFMNMRDGAFEYLLQKYIEIFPTLDDYITNGANINFKSLNKYFRILSIDEKCILEQRAGNFDRQCNHQRNEWNEKKRKCFKMENMDKKRRKLNFKKKGIFGKENEMQLRNKCKQDSNYIQFGSNGYQTRYYKRKFNDHGCFVHVKQLMYEYIKGLVWIQRYYYCGNASWNWYFPYHYSPLVSDLSDENWSSFLSIKYQLKQEKIKLESKMIDYQWMFEMGTPLNPLTQLALVLPKSSAEICIPPSFYHKLHEQKSIFKDKYPETFAVDLNWKELEWESVAEIPHIDVDQLQKYLANVRLSLVEQWIAQDSIGKHLLFFHQNSPSCEISEKWGCPIFEKDKKCKSVHERILKSLPSGNSDDICIVSIDIPSSVDFACVPRKMYCESMDDKSHVKENEKNVSDAVECALDFGSKKIIHQNLRTVSKLVYNCFASGRRRPRKPLKFAVKKPFLVNTSVKSLRNWNRKHKISNNSNNFPLKLKKYLMKQNVKKKLQNIRSNNALIAKFQSSNMDANNAMNVIMDSVINAMKPSKKKIKNENVDDIPSGISISKTKANSKRLKKQNSWKTMVNVDVDVGDENKNTKKKKKKRKYYRSRKAKQRKNNLKKQRKKIKLENKIKYPN